MAKKKIIVNNLNETMEVVMAIIKARSLHIYSYIIYQTSQLKKLKDFHNDLIRTPQSVQNHKNALMECKWGKFASSISRGSFHFAREHHSVASLLLLNRMNQS